MPDAKALAQKMATRRKERDSQRNAASRLAATMQPVYFVPATAPASKPAIAARAACELLLARAMTSTAVAVKNAIQMSGAPAAVICQKTTGERRNTRAASQDHGRDAHFRATHEVAAAARTPPRKSKASASLSVPAANPARINRCPWPVRKL